MSLDYIRRHYGVAVKRGQQVTVDGHHGKITGAHAGRLRVRFDDGRRADCHPTWRVEYLEQQKAAA